MRKVLTIALALILVTAMITGCGTPNGNNTSSVSNGSSNASGQSTDKQGEKEQLDVVFVPKLTGISWFNSMEDGLKDYAKEAGGMNITVSGAADTDPVQQAKVLEDVIAKKPDAIIVVANDAEVLDPVLKKAQDAGIMVIAQESSGIKNADVDVEFLDIDIVGQQYMDELAKAMGGKGGYAIMVGGLTVENHNLRADAAVKYQKEKYPDMYEVTSRTEHLENVEVAHNKTLELIKAHPDLKGVIYIGINGPIGAAAAVQEKNLQDKFFVVGTASPNQAKPFMDDKSITSVVIGSPYNIGKATAYVVEKMFEHNKDVSKITEVPIYGKTDIDGKTITFHADTVVTPENFESFGW